MTATAGVLDEVAPYLEAGTSR